MKSNISMLLRMGVNSQGTYSMETTHRPPLPSQRGGGWVGPLHGG